MYSREAKKMVAEQIINMLDNDILAENGMESFIGWVEDGDTFYATYGDEYTEEQIKEAKRLDEGGSKVDSIKYINQVVNDGLKTAKTYYDLYIHNK